MAEPGPQMTVAEAKAYYYGHDDLARWHSQPKCVCGDYITGHEDEPPHPCGFIHSRDSCQCYGYRYSRMGSGTWGVSTP